MYNISDAFAVLIHSMIFCDTELKCWALQLKL